MESVSVERLDHLGVVASVIKDLGLIEMLDARLLVHEQEEITTGEAVAGMILNGLGFSDRPLTLTPQFFANKPLDLLFHEGVRAERFNRFQAWPYPRRSPRLWLRPVVERTGPVRLSPRRHRCTLQPSRHHELFPDRLLCARQR